MDIVERLRTIKDPPDYDSPLCFEAADEIEKLRKDRKRLQGALIEIVSMDIHFDGQKMKNGECAVVACAALKKGE